MNWSIAATGVSGTVLFAMLVLIFKAGKLIGIMEKRMEHIENDSDMLQADIRQLQSDIRSIHLRGCSFAAARPSCDQR